MITLRYGANGPFASSERPPKRADRDEPIYEASSATGITVEMVESAIFYENIEALGSHPARPAGA